MTKLSTFNPNPGLGFSPRLLTFAAGLLLIAPHLVVILTSFDPSPAAHFPPQGFSLKWYANAFTRPAFREALALSLIVASGSTVMALVAGTMAALLVVRHRFFGRSMLVAALQAPMMIPEVVLGLGFLILFAHARMYSSVLNLLLAHAIITLPYAVRVIAANLQTTGRSIEEAAYLLGAGPISTFFKVTLPVIKDGMLAAAIFSFAVSFDNFTVTAFLVSDRGTLPIEIYSYIRTESDPTVAAISSILIAVSLISMLLIDRIVGVGRVARSGGIQ